MVNCYTRDLDAIRDALMSGSTEDIELIGNALTALVAIVQQQQQTIEKQQEEIKRLSACTGQR